MAILITNNTPFKPMSFDEMLKPYLMATEEYNKLEAGIAELDSEAESMRQVAQREIDTAKQEERDPKSFATEYMAYADSLDAKAEELATKGLKAVNRKSLYDLQNQYKTKVKPIEDADKYIKEIAKEQRLLNKDGNIVFDRDFSNGVSIQDVLDNPSLGYTPYDLEDYAKSGALIGNALMNTMEEQISLNRESGGQWFDVIKGVSEQDFSNWLSGRTDNIPKDTLRVLNTLKNQVDDIVKNAPEGIRNKLRNKALEGAYSSLKEILSFRENKNFLSDYQREQLEYKREEARRKAKEEANKYKEKGFKNIDRTTLSFATDKENMKNLSDYIDDKGNLLYEDTLFDENGKLKPYIQGTLSSYPSSQGSFSFNGRERKNVYYPNPHYNDIVQSLSSLGYTMEEINNMTKDDIKALFNSFKEESRTDAAARQVYRFSLDNTATEHIKNKLISEMEDAELSEITSISEGKAQYGKKKSISKIFEEDQAANVLFDPVDNEFRIQANGKYYKLPKGMLSDDLYSKINNYLQPSDKLNGMSKLQATQNAIEILENKKSLTPDDYLRLLQYYNDLYEIDSLFGTIGNNFVKYVGKKNINE